MISKIGLCARYCVRHLSRYTRHLTNSEFVMSKNEQDKKKIYVCSHCNKVQDISLTHNRGTCCCSCIPQKFDYIEDVVCKQDDIDDNEMKVVTLGKNDAKVLLVKQNGEIHALGTKCTHYGAPLHTGALTDGKIRCPWHGACFNIKTGDIEDYPGLDSLPCYKVTINEAGSVLVRANIKDLETNKRTKYMYEYDTNNTAVTVIVGGGPAGATCAETLRQEGFTGRIILICKENVLPYDRVKVSKVLDFDVNKFALRPQSFYDDHKIETRLGLEAIGLDTDTKTVMLNNSETLTYNHLFICTGSKAVVPDLPGVDLGNIFVLRVYNDSHTLHKALHPDKHVVIYGLGFIGMEVAYYCIGKCASITIVGRDNVPLKSVFGVEIGEKIGQEFEKRGAKFIYNCSISKFLPKEDNKDILGKIELTDDQTLEADICIIGIGAAYYTDWLKESGIRMTENGGIIVNKYMKTSAKNVYAGGDIAYAPVLGSSQISANIGHYGLAHHHVIVVTASLFILRRNCCRIEFQGEIRTPSRRKKDYFSISRTLRECDKYDFEHKKLTMSSYKPVDFKKEEFRKYLERAGVMDAITKVLVSLYEETEKPNDALEYILKHLGDITETGGEVNTLKKELDDARAKITELQARLVKYEPEEANE